ncbi:MAG: transporter substrate-binding protein, partial [Planctomycetaceae bacterium]
GNAASPNLICGGALPNQQVLPSLDWLLGPQGGNPTRLVFVGSDGLYSRTTHHIATKYLATKDRQFEARFFLPQQTADWSPVLDTLAQPTGQTAILSTLAGDANGEFFGKLRAQLGSGNDRVTVLSLRMGEDELRLLPPEVVRGQLAGATYFQSLATPDNQRFVTRFKQEFGYDRVTSDAMESAYSLVHLWALAVAKAGAFHLEAVRQALREVSFAGPGGEWRIDPVTQHTTKTFHLGRAGDDRQFQVIHSSPAPIAPDVFPQFAFPGWKCDLTAGGVTQGEPVELNAPGNRPALPAAAAPHQAPSSPSAK